ncbi:ImmA/IrrE family metallo-endopeptidase [Limimaricola sp. AA108-03]|uniref:ImmA/IrrE family metallo-endopeptidase n=1 Tax=Limimaricola sp. AA108-03 TaxID=3425945 RepID=UPI003D777C40
MSKFRLTLARRRGEQIAFQHGFDRFPVNPFSIAENEDILVEAKEPGVEGVSGCIVFNDDGVGIIYATDIRSEGFRRFTVAHELGHYFLDGHPEEILKTAPVHFSRAGFTQGDSSIEVEADHFASGLLMPSRLVRESLYTASVGLSGIRCLAQDAECSLTASAIRAAECAPYPMAVIVSRGEHVAYGFLSESFKKLGRLRFLRKGDLLPETATRTFNRSPANVRDRRETCEETTAERWFAGPQVALDEEIVGLGRYGFTLTVLTAENLTEDLGEEEDEEQKLVESWTPKFAYGR